MMNETFDLEQYVADGVKQVVKDAVRATLKDPREARFMAGFALATQRAEKRRAVYARQGEHIPTFLIASITSSCNLHCAGCYSRANAACTDEAPVAQLSEEEWGRIFTEADELGISFILLAGGEPMLRPDVIREAAKHHDILFPVFTNGTLFGDSYLGLFDENRNLLPIYSIEGIGEVTDERRGEGVYDMVMASMKKLHDKGMIFGASITVTTENMKEVYSREFLDQLAGYGCKAVIYVEFVPVTDESTELAPGEPEREYMWDKVQALREEIPEMVFVSFPGDEKSSGGCVAAGRGFFHINSHGGAEPCPFSPYSDINVKSTSVREALKSPLFRALRDGGLLLDDHVGGCTLHAKRAEVEALLKAEAARTE